MGGQSGGGSAGIPWISGIAWARHWPGSLGYYTQGAVEETQMLRWYAEALNAACEHDIKAAKKLKRPTLKHCLEAKPFERRKIPPVLRKFSCQCGERLSFYSRNRAYEQYAFAREIENRAMGLGRMLIVAGIVLIVLGVIVMLGSRLPIRFGHLPGDIYYRGRNGSFYFPIVTCLLLSVVLSVVMWLINRR